MDINNFAAKWMRSGAAERANKDAFILDLCTVLGVPGPDPTTGNTKRDLYVFEKDIQIRQENRSTSIGRADVYKHGCFILEAKQGSERGSKKLGTARRGTPAWNIAMRDAFGQALGYAHWLEAPPPFILTCDIGYCIDVYACFDGSVAYRPFPNAMSHRIYFSDLSKNSAAFDRLKTIFRDPKSLDPSRIAASVTRDIAEQLATLARTLEGAGHDPELVATFLMRCIFTMFAEHAGLLPDALFTKALQERWLQKPKEFPAGIESLWTAMNDGSSFGFVGKLLRFNGGLFHNSRALPLSRAELQLLLEAAKCNWAEVEPAIFGTLLERALDKKERHRLGAHFTPRAHVERLVRHAIDEPLRAQWSVVQAQVRGLVERGRMSAAKAAASDFLRELCQLRVLDPACGTGNFLLVAMDVFKRLEGEIVSLIMDVERNQSRLTIDDDLEISPAQFLGIETKRWAKEIAELALWIGYLQWHIRTRGRSQPFREPVLKDYRNIEHRDAVLTFQRKETRLDKRGNKVTRWDGSQVISSVTGRLIPDSNARVDSTAYVLPRPAAWPNAHFVIGNPPYLGARKVRGALGDDYVDALRSAYPEVPETADLVTYWWHKAAAMVESGVARRFGFITTRTITQDYSRPVIAQHLGKPDGIALTFAIADHPWIESKDGAAVRVAMTVGCSKRDFTTALVGTVTNEKDRLAEIEIQWQSVDSIGASLRAVCARTNVVHPLRANEGKCFQGVVPAGDGFKLVRSDLALLGINPKRRPSVVKPYVIGKDLVQAPVERFIIDFFGNSESEAEKGWPLLFQHVHNRVYEQRRHNKRASYRDKWWIFAEPRPAMRKALCGLKRFIVTPYTAKFRPFMFVDGETMPDAMAYTIASDDAYVLGVLSSSALTAT